MNPTTPVALLLIDVQQGFDEPRWGPRNNPDAERQIAALLAAWRRAKWPVLHVQHMSQVPGSPLRAGAPGNAFKPEAMPHEGEPVFRKTVNSAFTGTGEPARRVRPGAIRPGGARATPRRSCRLTVIGSRPCASRVRSEGGGSNGYSGSRRDP